MRLRALLAAACLAAAAAAPARAADPAEREAVFLFGGDDPALRADVDARILPWIDEILDPARAPKDWDATKLGPWDVVVRRAGRAVDAATPGRVWIMVSLDGEGLPTAAGAAEELARRILDGYRTRIELLALARRVGASAPAEEALALARKASREAEATLRSVEVPHGGPPSRRAESVAARLRFAEADAAATRVDRAVAARKLENARDAAQRAAAHARLADEVAALERELGESRDAAARDALRAKLEALRRTMQEAAARCPSLESARERVFALEVDLVGLETRETVLAAEIAELRAVAGDLAADVRRHEAESRAAAAAEAAAEDAARRLEAAQGPRRPPFEVVRPPSPVRKKEK